VKIAGMRNKKGELWGCRRIYQYTAPGREGKGENEEKDP